MTYYNLYVNWALVVSDCISAVGFWAYTLEVIQGRIKRKTRWSELSSYQRELAFMTLLGLMVFLLTLIIHVVLRSNA